MESRGGSMNTKQKLHKQIMPVLFRAVERKYIYDSIVGSLTPAGS